MFALLLAPVLLAVLLRPRVEDQLREDEQSRFAPVPAVLAVRWRHPQVAQLPIERLPLVVHLLLALLRRRWVPRILRVDQPLLRDRKSPPVPPLVMRLLVALDPRRLVRRIPGGLMAPAPAKLPVHCPHQPVHPRLSVDGRSRLPLRVILPLLHLHQRNLPSLVQHEPLVRVRVHPVVLVRTGPSIRRVEHLHEHRLMALLAPLMRFLLLRLLPDELRVRLVRQLSNGPVLARSRPLWLHVVMPVVIAVLPRHMRLDPRTPIVDPVRIEPRNAAHVTPLTRTILQRLVVRLLAGLPQTGVILRLAR